MSRVVYVGHVPFDLTEEQIEDIFRSAGPVEQTRLVFDRATGKSKGFAFVQYYEPESAASAVRNLDNYKVGGLHLKVNYSSGKFPGNAPGSSRRQGSAPEDDGGVVPEIVSIVSGLPQQQKVELLQNLKVAVERDRAGVQHMLDENPQLAYAIVQGMFELGKIDGQAAASLIVESPSSSRQQTPKAKMPPEQMQMYQQIMSLTPEQLNALPPEQRQIALDVRAQMGQM